MTLANFIILLSILHYGHCLTLTLEELENWKKLMKAELKQEIFLEMSETEEIKRINQKIQEVTKGNEEIITVVQSHGISLDSFQEFKENFKETGTQIESLSRDFSETKILVENHSNLLTDIVAKQNETEVTIQSQSVELTEDLFGQFQWFIKTVNDLDLDELEVNQTKFQAIMKTNLIQLETDIDEIKNNQNESLVIVNNQINDLENSFSGLGVNQTEEFQQALGVSL